MVWCTGKAADWCCLTASNWKKKQKYENTT
jgi:hypothetical protein